MPLTITDMGYLRAVESEGINPILDANPIINRSILNDI